MRGSGAQAQSSARNLRAASPAFGKLNIASKAKIGPAFAHSPVGQHRSFQLTFQPRSLCTGIRSRNSGPDTHGCGDEFIGQVWLSQETVVIAKGSLGETVAACFLPPGSVTLPTYPGLYVFIDTMIVLNYLFFFNSLGFYLF